MNDTLYLHDPPYLVVSQILKNRILKKSTWWMVFKFGCMVNHGCINFWCLWLNVWKYYIFQLVCIIFETVFNGWLSYLNVRWLLTESWMYQLLTIKMLFTTCVYKISKVFYGCLSNLVIWWLGLNLYCCGSFWYRWWLSWRRGTYIFCLKTSIFVKQYGTNLWESSNVIKSFAIYVVVYISTFPYHLSPFY